MIFIAKDVSRIVFEGNIFGGAQNIWSNPYLNSTTVYCLMRSFWDLTEAIVISTFISTIITTGGICSHQKGNRGGYESLEGYEYAGICTDIMWTC